MMTRIGLFIMIMSIYGVPAAAAVNCQYDLFSGPNERLPNETPAPKKYQRIVDLTMMQKQLWELRAAGKIQQYNHVKHTLENQLMLTKRDVFVGPIDRHKLYRATELSYLLARDKQFGHPEIIAFELNEELGGAVKIPVTVSHIEGSSQLWFGYSTAPSPMRTDQERQTLANIAQEDGDVFFFNFLAANADQHLDHLILDRDAGLVIFDFGAGFHISVQTYVFYSRAKDVRPARMDQYTNEDIIRVFKNMMAKTKFDWRGALNRMDERRFVDLAEFRLSKPQARALQGRIKILRALFNGADISDLLRSTP